MSVGAGIYVRISEDRTGEALGVARQEADCRALAERKGWTVTRLYTDNDVGAYAGKPRPAYRQLLDDLTAGHIDAVVVWHLDRLTRRPAELEQFFEICDIAGVTRLATCTGDTDLSTHDGRFMARILGAVARKESDDKSRRTKRKHLELAEAGKPIGGNRPFGYDDDRVTIRAEEANLIREAARRVLAGDTIRSICQDWARAGIPGPRGGRITQTTIRRILLSPRTAGQRALGGTIVAPGQWEPILDLDTHRRLHAILKVRAAGALGGYGPRRYVLTGILRCGKNDCGALLIARATSDRRRTYVCASNPDKPGCGGIRIVAEPLEDYVRDMLLHHLASDEVAAARRAREDGTEEADERELLDFIQAQEQALAQLAVDHYSDQRISRGQFLAASQAIEHKVASARRRLVVGRQAEVVDAAVGTLDADGWGALPIERQHAIYKRFLEQVTIAPARRGYNQFDPGRVCPVWRV